MLLDSRRWAIVAGVWLAVGLVDATRILFAHSAWDPDMDLRRALQWAVPDALLWIPLTPIPLWLGRRFPMRRPFVVRDVSLHLVVAGLVGAVHVLLDVAQNLLFDALAGRPEDFWRQLGYIAPYNTHLMAGTYLLIVGLGRAFDDRVRLRRERERTARLQEHLAEARLRSLHARLRPHFLFNALHTGSALISHDPEAARTLIRRLSDLLRHSLSTDERLVVPLVEEIEMVRTYLEIERSRFGDRLAVRVDVPASLERASVPPFLLQPLVENAIRHGLASRREGGTISILVREHEGRLRIDVEDDGTGLSPDATEGVGLSTTRSRLSELYRGRAELEARALSPQGTRIRIGLPLDRKEVGPHASVDRR